jgi:hypothetical protein
MSITRLGGQGGLFINLVTVTGPASYAAGGFALTPAAAGLTSITAVVPVGSPDGYVADYDASTGKVLAYGDAATAGLGPLGETDATDDLSGTTFTFLVFGKG